MQFEHWNYVSEGLKSLYSEWGKGDSFEKDENYLHEAFNFIEPLWGQQFNNITTINFVMISEAPRYGSKETYFYNPDAVFTSFFWFDDIKAFSKPGLETYSMPNQKKKEYVYNILSQNGFIILDIFPFAFNESETKVSYRNLKRGEYKQTLDRSYPSYLKLKLQLIKNKSHSETRFFYRYKFLKDIVNNYLRDKLLENQLLCKDDDIPCIGGKNMSLDRNLMKQFKEVTLGNFREREG